MSIHVEDLTVRYGARAVLDRVSLSVPPASIAALLGNNGAGKSTLFKVLCGLLQPSGGTVSIAGRLLPRQYRAARRATGYVAQQFGLYEDLTVEENIIFYARAYGLTRRAAQSRAHQMLERFELSPSRRERAATLSHGWKQRLALAAALAHEPSVLLLDEATAGLDPAARQYAWNVIASEVSRGTTVLLATHHLDEAKRCHAMLWLENGRLANPALP